MDDYLENDDSVLAKGQDVRFEVDNIEVVHGYADETRFDRGHESHEKFNQHEQEISHSLDTDSRDQIPESPEKSYPIPIGSDHDNTIETKPDFQERTLSTYDDSNHYQGEMDELHGSNIFKTSSHSRSQTFDDEMGTEDSPNSQEFPLTETTNQGARDSDLLRFPCAGRVRNIRSEKLQDDIVTPSIHGMDKEATDLQTGQSLSSPNESNKYDSPGDRLLGVPQSDLQFPGRSARGSISPMTRRQMSLSPEWSPLPLHSLHDHKHICSQQGSPDPSYEPRSHRQRISSPGRSDVHVGVFPDHLSPVRQTSASTHGIRQEPPEDIFVVKHLSASVRSHHSPPKYRKRNRSESRSPIQRRHSPTWRKGSPICHRDSPTGRRVSPTQYRVSPIGHRVSPTRLRGAHAYQRDYRERYRSRSPYSKFHHRSRSSHSRSHYRSRSPYTSDQHRLTSKRRQSPRHRSSIPEYHNSHRLSPRTPDEHADAAIRALDETEWNGRIILVEKSKS